MADSDQLILVAVGPDQVGLVRTISEFIVRHGCNIDDSKMAVFAGEFALILLMSGERSRLSEISRRSGELGSLTGLNIWVKEPSRKKTAEPTLSYQLVASCMDHPGIVYRLTNTLSTFGVNIESMETQTQAAPISGTNIFQMEAAVTVPAAVNLNTLRDALNQIEREENIDISFTLLSSSSPGR